MFGIIKNKFLRNKETGINEKIVSVVHLEGSEQLSIQIVSGYGASEKRERVVISEHEVDLFKNKYLENKPENKLKMENTNDNFTEMRKLLFETIRGVKNGTIDTEKAKAISSVSQTIINSVKLEIDAFKIGVKSVKTLE